MMAAPWRGACRDEGLALFLSVRIDVGIRQDSKAAKALVSVSWAKSSVSVGLRVMRMAAP
jgi:hypothetical protein